MEVCSAIPGMSPPIINYVLGGAFRHPNTIAIVQGFADGDILFFEVFLSLIIAVLGEAESRSLREYQEPRSLDRLCYPTHIFREVH
jgi:hypothetical protein